HSPKFDKVTVSHNVNIVAFTHIKTPCVVPTPAVKPMAGAPSRRLALHPPPTRLQRWCSKRRDCIMPGLSLKTVFSFA
ncbi:MAG: hypothetical protein ACI82O_003512, partial [Patiriisocius sp.]